MEREGLDCIVVCLVVLYNLLGPKVEHADCFVICAGENALVVGVELSGRYCSFEAAINLYLLLCFDVPNYKFLVLPS